MKRALQWSDLPVQARDIIEARVGLALKIETVDKGLMPGFAAHLRTQERSVFVKAVAQDSPAAPLYARERWAGTVLPPGLPAPRMLWSGDVEGWIVLLYEYLDGRDADLSPGSPDIWRVLDTVTVLGETLTPCPAQGGSVPDVAGNVVGLQVKAARLLEGSVGGLLYRAMYETALRGFTPDALAGNTLLHYDLHPGNLQISGEQAYAVDWAFAARGAAWIDPFMLVPRLILAGHPPSQAEALIGQVPAWRSAPKEPVTALAALWTLYRLYKAQSGPSKERDFRARAAEAGRSWVAYRSM
ncbi:phosphotransferase [Streptosporangium sp. NPDC001681]|uniref:phosphotransferase n=1 Tax=Streptosporangium sp. NPDC001681 TaxID=3154395 RepID=UPI0033200B6B